MSGVRLIQVPYHLGRKGEVLGAGPAPLAHAIGGDSVVVERPGEFRNEAKAVFEVVQALATAVRETVDDGLFPLILGGNCSSALGAVTGLDRDVGVVWFDAHGDFHTPDSTPTGFLEGMVLALLTGEGWDELRRGLRTVPPDRVVLVGARDFEPSEEERLARSAITRARSARHSTLWPNTPTLSMCTSISMCSIHPRASRAPGPLKAGSLPRSSAWLSTRSLRASRSPPRRCRPMTPP
jgi:hypothetical protein